MFGSILAMTKTATEPGMVVHIGNPSIEEAEVGRSRVPGQPGLPN
jgi:hypothetical protein